MSIWVKRKQVDLVRRREQRAHAGVTPDVIVCRWNEVEFGNSTVELFWISVESF